MALPAIVPGLIGAGVDLLGSLFGGHNQREANRQNIAMQREQRAWEQMMSNTAIQRRKADIMAAGGNPALAFTGGGEASTPSVSPARVEPWKPEFNMTAKALALMQADQMRAATQLTSAQTAMVMSQKKGQDIKNTVDNAFALQMAGLNMDLKTAQKQLTEQQWNQMEQSIKESVAREKNLQASTEATGLSNIRFQRMTDAIVSKAMTDAREGQINVEALENIAKLYGVEAGKAKGVIDTIINGIKAYLLKR